MPIKWSPANFAFEVLIWQGIYNEVMAKAKELGAEESAVEVVIQYEGIVPSGPHQGEQMVGVVRKDKELGRTGERFFY